MTVKLNLGCGEQRLAAFIGVDRLWGQGADVIGDLEVSLPFATASVHQIYAKSFLEHIDHLEQLLSEINRVLVAGGELVIYVPHWSNPLFYSDYTHRRFFGLASFDYFAAAQHQLFRPVPQYSKIRLKTKTVRLLFDSPFPWMRSLLKAVQLVVNRSRTFQLFYEVHLSHVIPCYAVEYVLQKTQ